MVDLSPYRRKLRVWWLRSPYTGRDIALLFVVLAVLVITWSFNLYLHARANFTDKRAETFRASICAILSGLPIESPPYILKARKEFARHPGECDHHIYAPHRHSAPHPHPTHTLIVVIVVPSSHRISSPTTTQPSSAPEQPEQAHQTPPPQSPTPPSRKPSPAPSPHRVLPTVCLRRIGCV